MIIMNDREIPTKLIHNKIHWRNFIRKANLNYLTMRKLFLNRQKSLLRNLHHPGGDGDGRPDNGVLSWRKLHPTHIVHPSSFENC